MEATSAQKYKLLPTFSILFHGQNIYFSKTEMQLLQDEGL